MARPRALLWIIQVTRRQMTITAAMVATAVIILIIISILPMAAIAVIIILPRVVGAIWNLSLVRKQDVYKVILLCVLIVLNILQRKQVRTMTGMLRPTAH